MTSTRLILAALVLGTALVNSQANAQCSGNAGSCNTTNTASVNVGALVKLGMSAATSSLTSPTADEVEVGAVLPDAGPSFTIKANRSWTMNIKSGNPTNFTYVGSNSGVKPISDLAWSTSAGGTFNAITSSDALFSSGASSTNGAAAQAFFRTTWAAGFTQASNAPGTYSLPVIFTLSAP